MSSSDDVFGEYPAYIDQMPGAIKIDEVPHRLLLAEQAKQYLANVPELQQRARQAGKDLVAIVSAHGKEIIIGVGVASVLTGGVILYRHPRRKKGRSKKK